jgi:hypothetical protein
VGRGAKGLDNSTVDADAKSPRQRVWAKYLYVGRSATYVGVRARRIAIEKTLTSLAMDVRYK